MCSSTIKGQGSTEYLVLLAMVLVVAMVAIALLGFFPGLSGDTKKAQSDTYWRGNARPIAIIDSSATGTTLSLQLKNLGVDTISIAADSIYASDGTYTDDSHDAVSLTAGESAPVDITMGSGCDSGKFYELNVTFTYDTKNGLTGAKQVGTKPLVVICG
jgi:uncharacterized protein (UPF0333 family)